MRELPDVFAGRYRLIERIGEGGMSIVYRAEDRNTRRDVAVKILREEFEGDTEFVERFEREALAASRMTHPNIVTLLDVGEERGFRYIVIEYVSGKTVKQIVRETGCLRPDVAVQVAIRILAAIQHAHQNGIIHRDIKPQNVLIDQEGVVKVTDFGIARMVNTQTQAKSKELVMGSVHYFSPEQARGELASEQSDVYSAGVTLYEMLTGHVPFQGETSVAVAMQHLQAKPEPPSNSNPAIPYAIERVVLKAMEKDPSMRYASASLMLQDLRAALRGKETSDSTSTMARQQRYERERKRVQKRRLSAERRTKWMRRLLTVMFASMLLAMVGLLTLTIVRTLLIDLESRVVLSNYVNMNAAEAERQLYEKGLEPVLIYETFLLISDDIVARQSPEAGTVLKRGSAVYLTISQSTFDFTMPTLVGLRIEDAERICADYGIIIESQTLVASDSAEGIVVEQSIEPRTMAKRGDTVRLKISGSAVVMPKLHNLTENQAIAELAKYRLLPGEVTYEYVTEESLIGVVLTQSVPPFERILPNQAISMTIGKLDRRNYAAPILLSVLPNQPRVWIEIYLVLEDGTLELEHGAWYVNNRSEAAHYTIWLRSEREGEQRYRIYYDGLYMDDDTAIFMPGTGGAVK